MISDVFDQVELQKKISKRQQQRLMRKKDTESHQRSLSEFGVKGHADAIDKIFNKLHRKTHKELSTIRPDIH